uniref:Uncharacterized protein n=1 Tax=Knipowitschia caucasica TaxID=637954 RepID=A0AAV2K9Z9_KNICA
MRKQRAQCEGGEVCRLHPDERDPEMSKDMTEGEERKEGAGTATAAGRKCSEHSGRPPRLGGSAQNLQDGHRGWEEVLRTFRTATAAGRKCSEHSGRPPRLGGSAKNLQDGHRGWEEVLRTFRTATAAGRKC